MKTITKEDCKYEGTISLEDGRTIKLAFPYDQSHGAPWKEFDGHGPVRAIRSLEEKPFNLPVTHP